MAELTIVFRLRFAVALTAAVCLLLVFTAGDAGATQARYEYIVQMDRGEQPGRREADRPDARRACHFADAARNQRLRREPQQEGGGAAVEAPARQVHLAQLANGDELHRHERRLRLPGGRRDDGPGQDDGHRTHRRAADHERDHAPGAADAERRRGRQGLVARHRPRRGRGGDRHRSRRRRAGLPAHVGRQLARDRVGRHEPVRQGRKRPLRARHARGRPDRGEQPQLPHRAELLRPLHGRGAAGEHRLGQGLGRRRQHDGARRHQRHPVRGRPQDLARDPRGEPLARPRRSPSRTAPIRSTRRSSRPGSTAWSSWPRRATRARSRTA